ncbi:GumC family protein [Thermodesulfobacteriota bacterium]
MNQTPPPDYVEDEINLIDLIYPIYKRRKFLILFCFMVVIFVGLWTMRMAKVYQAKAVILPEAKESASGGELKAAFLQQFGIAGVGGSSASPTANFGAVLKSAELAEEVLERYNYFYIKGVSENSINNVIESFANEIKVVESRNDSTLSITIYSNDPVIAVDLANSYTISLDEYNRTNSLTSAQRLRKYIEKRLDAAGRELEVAQKDLRKFQQQKKAISISKQAEATLEVLSEMESQLVALEVEKAAKQRFYRGPHIEIEQMKAKMDALQKNIDRLTYSAEPKVDVERERGKIEFYIPLAQIPELSFEESRILLTVKAKTGVVTMLTTQLEQAKLDEARDMPTINLLDTAKTPERIKPKLKTNVLLAAVVSLFMGIFLIFLIEFIQKMEQDPETSPKWLEMKNSLRNTIPFIRRKKKNTNLRQDQQDS